MIESVRFPIGGMTCTSCVALITRAVRGVAGVASVKVDLGSDSATIAFDPAQSSLEAVAEAIRKAGYEPHVEEAEPADVPARAGRFGLDRLAARLRGDQA